MRGWRLVLSDLQRVYCSAVHPYLCEESTEYIAWVGSSAPSISSAAIFAI